MKILKYLTILLFVTISNVSFAQNFPIEITANFRNPVKMGEHRLKILIFHIYDIKTYVERGFLNKKYRQKFAININYNRNFSKQELVDASIEEITRIDKIDKKTQEKYREYLNEIFVNVKKGDTKTALISEDGLKIFFNNQLTGQINDYKFALSFADIWLSENAKYQKMQKDLLKNIK